MNKFVDVENMSISYFVSSVIAMLFALFVVYDSFYVIDEGERGVVVKLGTIRDVSDSGLHFKVPLISKVHKMSIRNEVIRFENLEAYTTDQQTATIERINVQYRIPADKVADVYRTYGTAHAAVDRFVGRRVNEELEKVFGQISAERSVRERTKLSADVSASLKNIPPEAPFEIISVELESFAYPVEYTERVNQRMNAQVEVDKKTQEVLQANQDRQKAQHESDARAYEISAKAQAEADAIRKIGEAEAYAIREKAEALKASSNLVELTKAERWDGKLPTSMIPNSAVPFLDVAPNQ